jgi:DNA polymerase III alpha subunit (gram-positive type)
VKLWLPLAFLPSLFLFAHGDALAIPGRKVRMQGQKHILNPKTFRRRTPMRMANDPDAPLDATFNSSHPSYQRLVQSQWYTKTAAIDGLRRLSARLRQNRRVDRSTKVKKGEYLVFDLETTGLSMGGHIRGKGFEAGWDDISEFGYAIVKDGKIVKTGSIKISPDATPEQGALDAMKKTVEQVKKGIPFEQAAKEILELMQGRVLVGHNAKQADWAWLRSSMARLGVDMPGPQGLILDTMLIAANTPAKSYKLAKLAEKHDVVNEQAHTAIHDAVTTAKVFLKEIEAQGLETIGAVMDAQKKGEANWAERRRRRAEKKKRK